jgi:hypothetical protein
MEYKWLFIFFIVFTLGTSVTKIFESRSKTERIKYITENIEKFSPETRGKLEGEIIEIVKE